MSRPFSQSNFCQFGGHDLGIPRTGRQLGLIHYSDNHCVSTWPVSITRLSALEICKD